MTFRRTKITLLLSILFVTTPAKVWAERAHIAVAANFAVPMKSLADLFEKETGHKLILSFNSSGKIFAQITQGAPYDLFLSADQDKPKRLIKSGLTSSEYSFTYAEGKLALWSPNHNNPEDLLKHNRYSRLALANARLAPYGTAAKQVLENLVQAKPARNKLIVAESVSQTYQFVASGNVEMGFVALSQVISEPTNSVWSIPHHLHAPIKQDATLLKRGANNQAAIDFYEFLQSAQAAKIITSFGYAVKYSAYAFKN